MAHAMDGVHDHVFLGEHHDRNARRTWMVIGLTAAMMAGEILAGWLFGSMALLADGFHMATHAGALLIAALAYGYARRHAHDERFTFGTGKLGELAGYTSAVILGIVALFIGVESIVRLFQPVTIRFEEAIVVAVIGLGVNLLSAYLLHDHSGHDHGHGHGHHHDHRHDHHSDHPHDHAHDEHHEHDHRPGPQAHDHNLRSAYFHVLADALTSVLAIAGLVAGRAYGWTFMDPLMGIVGAIVIARWSVGLLRGSAAVLLDASADSKAKAVIQRAIEADGARIVDLHVWDVGPGHRAAIVSLVADRPQTPAHYKRLLGRHIEISHLTVEVNAPGA